MQTCNHHVPSTAPALGHLSQKTRLVLFISALPGFIWLVQRVLSKWELLTLKLLLKFSTGQSDPRRLLSENGKTWA